MAQLSRPFQIALAGFVLCAAVLLFALHGRSSGTSGSGSATSVASAPATPKPKVTKAASSASQRHTASSAGSHAAATKPNASGKLSGSSGHVYHGSAPGLEGLTRDVNRAHEAVSESGESPSAQAGSSAAPSATHTNVPAKATAKRPASAGHSSAGGSRAASVSAQAPAQRTVEADLAKGKIVVLLFWNPQGADDVTVHEAVRSLVGSHSQGIAVQEAPASQVASYGSITRGVQVYATPTILVINKQGQTIVLTGLQDAFSIEQAIDEARNS
jgi:hypothetical protein